MAKTQMVQTSGIMDSIHLEDLTGSILMRIISNTELQINI